MAKAQIDDGGPAFPATWENTGDLNATAPDGQLVPPSGLAHMQGMSLRDHFATHAPPPPRWWLKEYHGSFDDATDLDTAADHLAQWNYAYADAMLRRRR